MFQNLKMSLVQNMVNNGMIDKEDAELYCFGFDTLKTYLYAIVITLGIGFVMHSVVESIVFLIAFKLLRTTAGGYHTSNYFRCFCASSVLLTVALEIIKYNKYFSLWVILLIVFINILMVFLLAPLPDDNKPLSPKERVYHKKKSRIVVILESVFILVTVFCNKTMAVTVLMAQVSVTLLLLSWVIIRKLQLNKKEIQV